MHDARVCPRPPAADDEDDTVPMEIPVAVLRAQSGVRSTHPDDLKGRYVNDRYYVRGVLGEGGVGIVYEAEHLALGRLVALKVLRSSNAATSVAVKRFEREARAASIVGHPNVCKVFDCGSTDDGRPFVAMEKLVGTTLSEWIRHAGPLSAFDLGHVMRQVLAGLIAAHDRGIVHRDIKPDNIFLVFRNGAPPDVKILDFGISKTMSEGNDADELLHLTSTGVILGTPYYMSPEQAEASANAIDERTDVYSLGVTFYEGLAGRRPFRGCPRCQVRVRNVRQQWVPARLRRVEEDAHLPASSRSARVTW